MIIIGLRPLAVFVVLFILIGVSAMAMLPVQYQTARGLCLSARRRVRLWADQCRSNDDRQFFERKTVEFMATMLYNKATERYICYHTRRRIMVLKSWKQLVRKKYRRTIDENNVSRLEKEARRKGLYCAFSENVDNNHINLAVKNLKGDVHIMVKKRGPVLKAKGTKDKKDQFVKKGYNKFLISHRKPKKKGKLPPW
ncbi:uncharacterized protein LOC143017899 [Oratosquilla oratoria]|uniref:uncharacterized protein LOC143017899 n=1 Tax=Oratosquilla oratoria TaxID=337810 RepID=UPI003F763E99